MGPDCRLQMSGMPCRVTVSNIHRLPCPHSFIQFLAHFAHAPACRRGLLHRTAMLLFPDSIRRCRGCLTHTHTHTFSLSSSLSHLTAHLISISVSKLQFLLQLACNNTVANKIPLRD